MDLINFIIKALMQKQSVLFKFFLGFIFTTIFNLNSYAQTGLNFQGVARSSNNVIIASQQISLRLSILQGSATGNIEYSETRKVTTNAQGLFAVVIGDADATNTLGSFTTINWKNTPKYLKIEMDANAGSNFTTMGTTQFQYVAYAQFASSVDAENIAGVVPVAKGGTGVATISALKTVLVLDKINNTSDADKPISTKTQTALDLKLNAADTSKYPKLSFVDSALLTKFKLVDTIKYTKQAFTDSSLSTKLKLSDTANMLSNRIGKDTLSLSARINTKANTTDLVAGLSGKVDKVNGKDLSTNDYTTAEKTKLAAIIGTNTGDQDLSSYATNTTLALKANAADVATSLADKFNKADTSFLLQKKDTITLSNRIDLKANAADVATSLADKFNKADTTFLLQKMDTITLSNRIDLKANATDLVTGLSGKVDKVTGKDLSTNDYADLTNKPDLTLKENTNNKSTDFNADLDSDIKFPSVKAVKGYVDAANVTFSNGLVNLTNEQTIVGKKTFNNDLIMGNKDYVAGVSSPATINFANGSKIGDIQNINDGNPDVGSIDLYAPDGAKWVQLNYSNSRYICLDSAGAYIDLGEFGWNFLENGVTEIPGNIILKNNNESNINSDNRLYISTSDDLRIRHDSETSYTRFGLFEDEASLLIEHYDELYGDWYSNEWNYKLDGSTWFPGNLNFLDNHSINFINTNTSSTSSSIYASGPYLKLNTRAATQTEIDEEEIDWGLELDYGNKNSILMNEYGISLGINPATDLNLNQSNVYLNNTKFLLDLANNNDYTQKNWIFNGEDGSTNLPGDLNLEGSIKIRNIDFSNLVGNTGDVLTLDGDGSVFWSSIQTSSGINSINGISSGTQSLTVNISSTDLTPSFNSDPSTNIHALNLPMASDNNVTAGLISKSDYDIFNGKQNSLSNPIVGISSGSFTRTTGLIPFFYDGENKITGSTNLFWDATNSRLGIRNQTPNYPVHINQGGLDEYGFMISSPPPTLNSFGQLKSYGSSIGFESNVGGNSNSNKGSFQLDADGNMVFRTSQSDLYFDNFGNGTTYFRVGLEAAHNNGMILDNTGNLEVRGTIKSSSDILTIGSIKTGSIVQDYQNNNVFTPTAIISASGDMTTPGSISASNFITTSDIRLKKNIKTIKNSLTLIKELNPVSYEKRQSLASNEYVIKESGFIAQDIQKILPNLVLESVDKDKLLSVNYIAIIPILTKGIQEQQTIIEDQKKRLEALEKLVNELIKKQ